MRRAIEQLLTRMLRSRVGLALVIALLVLGVVGTARLVVEADAGESAPLGTPAGPIVTREPQPHDDDGALATGPPPSPVTSAGQPTPAKVAERFAAAWLNPDESAAAQWREKLQPLSTEELSAKLAATDPAAVPAARITGAPVVIPRAANFVEARIPMDTGTLRLELVSVDGGWQVDAIDWERS